MTNAVVVCEGQTEEAFVKRILGPRLAIESVFVVPRLVPTSGQAKGGALGGRRVLRFLRNTLLEREDVYVTTFFDLHGIRPDFPGWSGRGAITDPVDRAKAIESELHREVIREAGCRPERFLPHIQPYEFEALLFSDTGKFAEEVSLWKAYTDQLEEIRRPVRSPEHINDGPETHPSARLQRLLRPRYNKVRHGVSVSARIGLDRMCAECHHFGTWLARLKVLRPL